MGSLVHAASDCLKLIFVIVCALSTSACLEIKQSSTGNNRLEILLPRAEAGDVEAQFLLGNFYSSGYDWPRDLDQSLDWYTRAAEQGHVRAQVYLGFAWETGLGEIDPDEQKAFQWYQRAAEQGNSQAIAFLGRAYHRGIGTQRDLEQSLQYFLQAAELGDGKAQYWAAKFLHKGTGGNKDPVAARVWYLLAIDHIVDGSMVRQARNGASQLEKRLSEESNQDVERQVAEYYSRHDENQKGTQIR